MKAYCRFIFLRKEYKMKKKAISIGKEIVVDIKEKVKCSSIKKRNGYQNQSFIGIKLPPKIKEIMTTTISRQKLPLPALTMWS